jgi:hypothetical protein
LATEKRWLFQYSWGWLFSRITKVLLKSKRLCTIMELPSYDPVMAAS